MCALAGAANPHRGNSNPTQTMYPTSIDSATSPGKGQQPQAVTSIATRAGRPQPEGCRQPRERKQQIHEKVLQSVHFSSSSHHIPGPWCCNTISTLSGPQGSWSLPVNYWTPPWQVGNQSNKCTVTTRRWGYQISNQSSSSAKRIEGYPHLW